LKRPALEREFNNYGSDITPRNKPSTVKELADREEVLEKTLNSMNKKVESLAASLKELQEKIQLELSKHNLRLQ
jgi:chaperonin cofactor prefoldin